MCQCAVNIIQCYSDVIISIHESVLFSHLLPIAHTGWPYHFLVSHGICFVAKAHIILSLCTSEALRSKVCD